MKVILLKDVSKVGKEGSEIEVKNGYARNFLIPRGFAISAAMGDVKKLQELKRQRERQASTQLKRWQELKAKIEAVSLTIASAVRGEDSIYGSINETQILKALKDEGISLDKGKLILEEPIKKLGAYNLVVELHSEVKANLRVWVVKK